MPRAESILQRGDSWPGPLIGLALLAAALQLASGWVEPWELLHDELYYWVGAKRLAFGYVDHPPLASWLLAPATAVFGDGRLAFELLPALCAAATVLLAGRMARSLGSGSFGQCLAGLCTLALPFHLAIFSFYSVNALELLLWATTSFLWIELIRTGNEKLWLGIGIVAGIALLNKHTYALLAAAIALGVVATPLRAQLRSRWLWIGVAIALLLASPNLVWNAIYDWPSLDFYRSRPKVDLPTTALQALEIQITAANPANLFVWLPGIVFLLFSRKVRRFRPVAIAFLLLFAVILLSGARRGDRIAGIYPVVLAAGASFWDQWHGRGHRFVRVALSGLVATVGALALPMTLPILSPQQIGAYFEAIGEKPEIESGDVGQSIPIYLMGRLEWQRFADEVIEAWKALPSEQRERSAVLAPHWVYASVIQYYGRDRSLGPVVAPHNAYWFWRDDVRGRDAVLAVAIPEAVLARYFAKTRELGIFRCEYCTDYRPDIPIVLASDPLRPLDVLMTEWRHFGIDPSPQLRP